MLRTTAFPFGKILAAGLLSLTSTLGTAMAQDSSSAYPTQTIRLVVPFAPGGTTDLLGRLLAERLGSSLQQTVVVENRPGAGSMLGTAQVARAQPDGHTLLFATSSALAISPAYTKTQYDPIQDFEPVMIMAASPMAVVVGPEVQAQNLEELIALAKAKPGVLNLASFGTGSASHLTGELFKVATDTDMLHVPFNGSNAALTELQAGRVDVMFDMVGAVLPHYEAGKVRILATTGTERSKVLPDVPTVAETVPDFESSPWFGIVAPAGTPAPIVQRLNQELSAALATPAVTELLARQSFEVIGGSPEDFARDLEPELAKWQQVVQAAGIQAP